MVKLNIPNVFTTPYTQCDKSYCVQKEIVIPGEPGKQTLLDELALSMCVAAKGATATAWVSTEIAGVPVVLATWTEFDILFTPKTATPGMVGKLGENIVLKWNLKTSNSAIRAKMKDLAYSYTIKETEKEAAKCLVVVECENQVEADAIAKSLVDRGASVYTIKAV